MPVLESKLAALLLLLGAAEMEYGARIPVQSGPVELDDNPESSHSTAPDAIPFKVNCGDAGEFAQRQKTLKARGLLTGYDPTDQSILMVFKRPDGVLEFARTDKLGTEVCIFGVTDRFSEVDIPTAFWNGEEKDFNQEEK
jgi:hypothetical protein